MQIPAMLRSFLSVVALELRAAFRSKAAPLAIAASLAWTLAAPHVVRGDGTDIGDFHIRVAYSLGPVFALSLVAFSASAAGTLARDRAAKRLQLSMVRPVRHAVIALGRMTALTICAALTLGASCLALCALEGNSRVCDHVHTPHLEDPRIAAERTYAEYCEKHPGFREKSEEVGVASVLKYLEQSAREEYATVATNETASWEFPSVAADGGGRLAVRVLMTDLFGRMDDVDGVFRFGGAEGRLANVNKTLVKVPLDGRANEAAGGGRDLSFSNNGKLSVSFQPRRDLRLLVAADGFRWNVLRAWIAMTATVSVAIAFAVFLGACLGRSVAVFSIVAILAAASVAPTAVDEAPDPFTTTAVDRVAIRIAAFADAATHPLNAVSPVASLADGECVERREVASAAFSGFVVFPLAFALLAGLAMSRISSPV